MFSLLSLFVPDARAAHQEKSSCAIRFNTCTSASSESEPTNVACTKSYTPNKLTCFLKIRGWGKLPGCGSVRHQPLKVIFVGMLQKYSSSQMFLLQQDIIVTERSPISSELLTIHHCKLLGNLSEENYSTKKHVRLLKIVQIICCEFFQGEKTLGIFVFLKNISPKHETLLITLVGASVVFFT